MTFDDGREKRELKMMENNEKKKSFSFDVKVKFFKEEKRGD